MNCPPSPATFSHFFFNFMSLGLFTWSLSVWVYVHLYTGLSTCACMLRLAEGNGYSRLSITYSFWVRISFNLGLVFLQIYRKPASLSNQLSSAHPRAAIYKLVIWRHWNLNFNSHDWHFLKLWNASWICTSSLQGAISLFSSNFSICGVEVGVIGTFKENLVEYYRIKCVIVFLWLLSL